MKQYSLYLGFICLVFVARFGYAHVFTFTGQESMVHSSPTFVESLEPRIVFGDKSSFNFISNKKESKRNNELKPSQLPSEIPMSSVSGLQHYLDYLDKINKIPTK